MAISNNAFQANQNENMDIVEVDVDPLASAVVDPTSEIVSDNDEFEMNADEVKMMSSHRHQTVVAKMSLSDWCRPYPTYALGPSSSHYTPSSPPGHPYPYQHGTPSPPVHALPAQHGTIPSSSHHSTPSPPTDVYPHDHGIRSSLSHHATPSPSAHPVHSPGVGDEHTSTSRRPPAPNRHSSMMSSSNRLRSSIPHAIEEIPDFFRPPTAPAEGENPFIYLIVEHDLFHPSSVATGKMSVLHLGLIISFAIYDAWCWKAAIRYTGTIYLIAKKRITHIYLTDEVFERYKRMRATDEAFKKKSEQMSTNRNLMWEGRTLVFRCIALEVYPLDIMEKKLQRRPTRKEMFRHLHTHGHDGQTFIDQRSAKIDVCALVAFDIGVAYREGVDMLKALGIDNIFGFDWLASPGPEAMIRALEVHYALGVFDEDVKLTSSIGFQVSEIPLDLDGKRSHS
ncbi:hypothetical protein Syun_012522 [Stephania yunnanensis]|uniref:Uncharacterized protein n=1 Tax=Stephania yunnanensis TaxID=152371 RepID=A0AAP0PGG7_9MAGN